MLNEDKIKLMTGIALFERGKESGFFQLTVFFEVIISAGICSARFFSYTICYMLCAVTWVLYHMDRLLNTLDIREVMDMGKACRVLVCSRPGLVSGHYLAGIPKTL